MLYSVQDRQRTYKFIIRSNVFVDEFPAEVFD